MDNENKKEKYKEGQQYREEEGTIVDRIIFDHEKIVALLLKVSKDGSTYYEVVFDKRDSDVSVNNEAIVCTEYYYLKSEIEHKAEKNKKLQMKTILVKSFCRAYLDDFRQRPFKYFSRSYEFLESCNANVKIEMLKNQILFVICSIFVSILLYMLDENLKELILPSLSGLFGGFVMIFYEMKNIQVSSYEDSKQLSWRYISKLICGLIFGFFMMIVIKSKLIFPDLTTNFYGICLLSFFAGMQAKWIPGIANKFIASNEK